MIEGKSKVPPSLGVLLAAALAPGLPAANQLEEIVVTAQKRGQNLGDVGIAVTAFTGETARELGLSQPLDLAAQTPNLNINNTFGNSITNVSIRGLGLNDYAVNNNPAAGIYVDEVYLVSPAMLTFQLLDVERIEVLKGPQGTLYGRNTTAGALNFISRKPSEETEGYLSASLGNFDLYALKGAIGGRMAPGLAGRFALRTVRQNEGHQYNRATGKDVGQVDRLSWRTSLGWAPSEDLEILLNVHGGRDESDTWLIKIDNSFTPIDDAFFPGNPFHSSGRPDTAMDIESDGAVATVNWDLSEQWVLTSVTGYEDYSRRHLEDRDGTALVQLDGDFENDIEQYSQEMRLTYTGDDLVLILGAFWGNDEVSTRDNFNAVDLGFGFFAVGNEYNQETDSAAVFAHSEWEWSENWRLTTGLRYTDESKDFTDAFTFLFPDALPRDGGNEVSAFAPVANSYDVSDVSGKIGIDYTGLEDALLYASFNRGFKSGAFQGQLTFNPDDLAGFDEENVHAWEAGFKSRLANNTLRLNGAVFFYDYEDVQIYGPHFDSEVGPLFGILNAGDAEVIGAELELLWRATEGLDIRVGMGLLDTEITRSSLPFVTEGSELPNAPETNFNINVKYAWNIGGSLVADVMFDSAYKDDVTYDIVRSPAAAREDGYWLTNLKAGISSEDGNWGVHLWGKNITDEEYRIQVLTSTVGFGESYGMPATYGVTMDFSF